MPINLKFKYNRSREMYVTTSPGYGPYHHMTVRTRKWSWRHPLAFFTWEEIKGSEGRRGGCARWDTGLRKCGYLSKFEP